MKSDVIKNAVTERSPALNCFRLNLRDTYLECYPLWPPGVGCETSLYKIHSVQATAICKTSTSLAWQKKTGLMYGWMTTRPNRSAAYLTSHTCTHTHKHILWVIRLLSEDTTYIARTEWHTHTHTDGNKDSGISWYIHTYKTMTYRSRPSMQTHFRILNTQGRRHFTCFTWH